MKRNLALHPATAVLSVVVALVALTDVVPAAEYAEPAAHARAACNRCHGAAQASFGTSVGAAPGSGLGAMFADDADASVGHAPPASTAMDRQCRSCHGDGPRKAGALGIGHADHGRRCTSCHQFHDANLVRTAAGSVDLAGLGEASAAHCQSCHAPGARLEDISEGHRAAARLYHAESGALADVSPSAACLRCHDRGSTSPWRQAAAGAAPMFDGHRSHAVGVPVDLGAGDHMVSIRRELDPRIRLFDGDMECQTCHQLATRTRYALAAMESPKALCLGCHEFKRGAAPAGDRSLMASNDR